MHWILRVLEWIEERQDGILFVIVIASVVTILYVNFWRFG